jgi:3-oxoacyl-[acyl-carrier-protein] synthase-1
MESKGIQRAGLSDIPVSALKGYYGHTMGAAGILETILTICATDDGFVLPTKGFTELGVSEKVNISNKSQQTNKYSFLKLISGFGGCNAAALYTKTPVSPLREEPKSLVKTHTIRLSSESSKSLTYIYKQKIGNYPKFYKMDVLTRLAFIAAELLKEQGVGSEEQEMTNTAIILFNNSSSIVADRQYLSTISDAGNFFPSPATFVYTLPNITVAEIAIRHHYQGETSFYILPEKDEALMQQILEASIHTSNVRNVISGWVDAESDTSFECELSMYKTTDKGQPSSVLNRVPPTGNRQ